MEILAQCKVCRVGTSDESGMMIVPMNYGYEVEDGCVRLYFHTGMDGRKIRAFRASPSVCFEIDGRGELITHGCGEKACDYSYAIFSAMGTGNIEFLEDPQQKQRALEVITLHQSGKSLPVPLEKTARVTVLCLTVQDATTRKKNC